jgi:hypothetical protein
VNVGIDEEEEEEEEEIDIDGKLISFECLYVVNKQARKIFASNTLSNKFS